MDNSSNTKKYILFSILGILICIGVGVALAMRDNGDNPGTGESGTSTTTQDELSEETKRVTEETKRVTEETINKYADITVEGYKEVEDGSLSSKAVVISVKNHSDEVTSLAIVMGAYDSDGNLLDTSSLYAEGIQPGQTHVFNTFVYSKLSPEQLESVTYKVYKASTYEAPNAESSTNGESAIIEEAPQGSSVDK